MNATLTQVNINRTNAKRLRAAGFYAEADAYDTTADELQDELNELDRRRIAAKHAAVNPEELPATWEQQEANDDEARHTVQAA